MQIKIEKNVPFVKRRSGGAAAETGIRGAIEGLQVGESFVVPITLRNLVTGSISTLKQIDKTKQYMIRKIGNTVRCWRIAPVQVAPTVQLEADLKCIEPEAKNNRVYVPLNDTINNALSGSEQDKEFLESLMQRLVSEYLSKIRKE